MPLVPVELVYRPIFQCQQSIRDRLDKPACFLEYIAGSGEPARESRQRQCQGQGCFQHHRKGVGGQSYGVKVNIRGSSLAASFILFGQMPTPVIRSERRRTCPLPFLSLAPSFASLDIVFSRLLTMSTTVSRVLATLWAVSHALQYGIAITGLNGISDAVTCADRPQGLLAKPSWITPCVPMQVSY